MIMFVSLRIMKYILVRMVQLVQRNQGCQEGPKSECIRYSTFRIPTEWFSLSLLGKVFWFDSVTNSVSMESLLAFGPCCPSVSPRSKLSGYASWTSDTFIPLSMHHDHQYLISSGNQTCSGLTLDPGAPGCPLSPGLPSYPYRYRLSEDRRDNVKSLLSFSQ